MQSNTRNWHRLSPVSVIFFISKFLSHMVKDALPGLAPLAVIIFNSDNKVWLTSVILIGLASLVILSSVLQYWFFKFSMEDNKVLINEGVFKKKHRTINFERIQNINILEPFFFRPFSLATLQIETAGSTKNEADLAGIRLELAQEIKEQALEAQKNTIHAEESEEPKQTELLAEADTNKLVRYGLTNNGMFWFFVFIAPVMGMLDDILEKWIGEENIKLMVEFLGGGRSGGVTLTILVLISTIILMISFSIIGSILKYHGYQLTESEQTLKRRGGLLSTHEESAKRSKIQAVIRQTNFIGRWLKIENLVFKQASNQQNQKNSASNLFVVPTRTEKESMQLSDLVFEQERQAYQLYKIDKRYRFKTWLIFMVPSMFITLLVFLNTSLMAFILLPLLGTVAFFIVQQRWKMYRYGLTERFAFVQSGFWGFKKIEFPLFKAQRVVINQSPLQRKNNLATLSIFLASDRITIPYMQMNHAQKWFNHISYRIETANKRWF